MRKLLPLLLILLIAGFTAQGQEGSGKNPNKINGGFYIKLGPSIPVGPFNATQYAVNTNATPDDTLKVFDQPKTGIIGDLGYLIYIGPAFANNRLRAAVDLTFLTGGYHPSKHVLKANEEKVDYLYFFAGQKIGPMITVNPIDRLMIDLSWKLCFNVSEYDGDYGLTMTQQEIMLGLRYRIVAFSLNYQFGEMNFNDLDNDNQDQIIDQNMLKIMVGLKF